MTPTKIRLSKEDGSLSLEYADGSLFTLSGEYLRVYSPSAEVRGHGPGQEVLQHGKKHIKVTHIKPSGNYGVQLTFSDGHDTGIYAWSYLYDLGNNHAHHWQQYLDRLNAAGKHRDPEVQTVQLIDPSKK